jgi:hypothetical protein
MRFLAKETAMGRTGTQVYKPGDEVPTSGIYKVTHNPPHADEHEVIGVRKKIFPPCKVCEHPRFVLVHAAHHIENSEHFGKWAK